MGTQAWVPLDIASEALAVFALAQGSLNWLTHSSSAIQAATNLQATTP